MRGTWQRSFERYGFPVSSAAKVVAAKSPQVFGSRVTPEPDHLSSRTRCESCHAHLQPSMEPICSAPRPYPLVLRLAVAGHDVGDRPVGLR
jgi:hypothetical protein